jgi:hypothetical protein
MFIRASRSLTETTIAPKQGISVSGKVCRELASICSIRKTVVQSAGVLDAEPTTASPALRLICFLFLNPIIFFLPIFARKQPSREKKPS